jgi:hypothetical protein
VTINGDPAQYTYKDPLSDVTMGSNTTIGNHQSYKGKYLTALKDADDGELKVIIPSEAVVQVRDIIRVRYSTLGNFTDTLLQHRLKGTMHTLSQPVSIKTKCRVVVNYTR